MSQQDDIDVLTRALEAVRQGELYNVLVVGLVSDKAGQMVGVGISTSLTDSKDEQSRVLTTRGMLDYAAKNLLCDPRIFLVTGEPR